MKRYQFFNGLDVVGVEDTIEAYTSTTAWSVKTMGNDSDGFWILFEAQVD
jgi:hypothetical protein